MLNEVLAHESLSQAGVVSRTGRGGRFFLGMSILLFVFVLVGFAKTFFLRAQFDVPAIPRYVYLHGVLLTTWFLLLVVQSSLVATGRIRLHRRLGIAAAIVAVAVVGVSIVTVHAFPARALATNLPIDAAVQQGFDAAATSMVVWNDYFGLFTFSLLVTVALFLRGRPESHRRLMLLASIAIVGPAVARMLSVAAHLAGWSPAVHISFLVSMIFGPPLALVVHDVVTLRRVPAVTGWGVACLFVQMFVSGAVANSAVGVALVTPTR